MKKSVLLIVVVVFTAFAFTTYSGVIGKPFPAMQCEDYNGRKVNLPGETIGKYTLLGMAFSNDAEADLNTWLNPIYNKFIASNDNSDPFAVSNSYDINLYVIPMFTGANQLTSKSSKEKIKSHTEKELYPHLLFYEGAKTYKEDLDFEKKGVPYFFVLDKNGKIVYATSGRYDDKKLEKIIDILEEN
jgi:hypothetical protein